MVTLHVVDMGVMYTHANGRTLEALGEGDSGEWMCYESNDDDECYAQGSYERDGDEDVMMDEDGNELARLATQEDWERWAEKMLAS